MNLTVCWPRFLLDLSRLGREAVEVEAGDLCRSLDEVGAGVVSRDDELVSLNLWLS